MTGAETILVNGVELINLRSYSESVRRGQLRQADSKGRMVVASLHSNWVCWESDKEDKPFFLEYGKKDKWVYQAALRAKLDEYDVGALLADSRVTLYGENLETSHVEGPHRLFDAETGAAFKLKENYRLELAEIFIEPEPEPSVKPAHTPEPTPAPPVKEKPLKPLAFSDKPQQEQEHTPTLRLKLLKIVHDKLIEKYPHCNWGPKEVYRDNKTDDSGERYGGLAHEERKKLIDDIVDDCRDNVGLSPEDFETRKKALAEEMLKSGKEMLKRGECEEELSPAQAREVLEVVLPENTVCKHLHVLLSSKRGRSDTSGQLVAVDDLLKVINSANIDFENADSNQVGTSVKNIVGDQAKGFTNYHKAIRYVLTTQIKLNEKGAEKPAKK